MTRPRATSQTMSRSLPLSAHLLLNTAMLAAALTIAAPLLTKPANATGYDPNYRYCVSGLGVMYDAADCTYNTLEQCRISAQGAGYCSENPVWRGNTAKQPRPQPSRGSSAR